MTEDFRVLGSNAAAGLKEVRLYDKTWEDIKGKHPEFARELPSMTTALDDAIGNPTGIFQSATSPEDSLVFVQENTTNNSGDPLRVPVAKKNDGIGVVKTAYFASSSSHGTSITDDSDGS